MRAVEAEPSLSPPVNVRWSEPTSSLGHRSQTEISHAASPRNDFLIELIESLILEQNQRANSLNNNYKQWHELEYELHEVQAEKSTLVAIIDLQTAKIKTLKAEKESLEILIFEQDRPIEPER